MTQKIGKSGLTKILVLVLALVLAGVASIDFYTHRHTKETVVAAEGLTEMRMLSDWVPSLKGTFGDTPVFFYDSGVEGSTVLYVGGTHPYEPAASLSAYVLLENPLPPIPIDEFIRKARPNTTYYIGAVFNFHD